MWSAAADISWRIPSLANLTLSGGYAWLRNTRSSQRRDFRFTALDALPIEVAQQRPDFLLSDFNVYTFDIVLTEVSGTAGAAAYDAKLEVDAFGGGKVELFRGDQDGRGQREGESDHGPVVGGEVTGQRDGSFGDALDPAKREEIYASLADYIVFLKEEYGVEAAMFSFNESDLGIDVRQTAEEHAELIRGFGAYLGGRGLATRMLLGDTSDATAMDFIVPAMQDAEALRHVAALSFHSWRGWGDDILEYWGETAAELNVPLLVGEGSTDAGAWRYPAVFTEPTFALEEIELYTRMMAIAQPLSILQWQLTADYSLLAGGGIFGDSTELRPTQRFWNLKQLAASPRGFYLPLRCEGTEIRCAAVGDVARGRYALHIVNAGAGREALVTGIPTEVEELVIYVTDPDRGMEKAAILNVSDGEVRIPLAPVSYTSAFSFTATGPSDSD